MPPKSVTTFCMSFNTSIVVFESRFEKALLDPKLFWKGSSNQRVIDVPKSLASGEVVLHA